MRFESKPLRSALYVPGNKEDWMRKAPKYGADALILDLEDSVPLDAKSEARDSVRRMLDELGSQGQTLVVRVNPLDSGLTGDDLEAVVCDNLYGIILPKVQSPSDIFEADVLLRLFERRAGVEIGKTFIDPGLETAEGIRQAYDIARASDRVAHLGLGAGKNGDTARSVGYLWTPEGTESLYIRSKVLLDARAAGIQYPMTGGWFDIRDLDGLRRFAVHSRQIGFTGMHLIHPGHVPVVNEVFTPTADEIAAWRGLVEAMEARRTEGGAAVTFGDDMVDIAHEATARAMLAMAERLGVLKE
jgi:citrate lyase subunit beta/citryl-CoA lyase